MPFQRKSNQSNSCKELCERCEQVLKKRLGPLTILGLTADRTSTHPSRLRQHIGLPKAQNPPAGVNQLSSVPKIARLRFGGFSESNTSCGSPL